MVASYDHHFHKSPPFPAILSKNSGFEACTVSPIYARITPGHQLKRSLLAISNESRITLLIWSELSPFYPRYVLLDRPKQIGKKSKNHKEINNVTFVEIFFFKTAFVRRQTMCLSFFYRPRYKCSAVESIPREETQQMSHWVLKQFTSRTQFKVWRQMEIR